MVKLFGTDGIRGLANQYPITPEMGIKLGRAVIRFCKQKGINPSVVIGRDTRASGEMLDYAIASGALSAGGNVYRVGVLPTPGVAYLVRALGGGAGIVVSASHNPHDYNGFKVFSHEGFKLSDDEESQIEDLIFIEPERVSHCDPGSVKIPDHTGERYASFLRKTLPDKYAFHGMKIVLDCANGAAFRVAPILFKGLGPEMEVLFAEPDGKNINLNCGSQHTETLRKKVVDTGADAGLAFDGDADRLIVVDEKGEVLTGDQILTICARMLMEQGRLKNNLVVSTVMSNIGFRFALEDLGIKHISTRVGDRYVMEAMRAQTPAWVGRNPATSFFSTTIPPATVLYRHSNSCRR